MSDNKDDLEYIMEEAHLKGIIKELKSELLKYIEKRKNVSNNIVEYRQKALEHYEDDEDKVAEYFDHEAYVLEKSFEATDRKIKEITTLIPSPYFGRVDFKEEGEEEEENLYIGRFGFIKEGTFEPLVVDWRAPIASMFYAGKLGDVQYTSPNGPINVNVSLKRQFIIKREKLVGMFNSAVDVKDDILQQILSENSSSEKLKDIIMTIQEEQDNIIRRPREKTVIVNGVAGSGKTTIALHRVAYLLYNFRNVLQDKVLILGPNNIFMEYISTVLPSLGEVGVNQKTFRDFALEYLELDYNNLLDMGSYMSEIMKGNESFIASMVRKTSKNYIKELDGLISNIDDDNPLGEVKYYDKTFISLEEITDMFRNYYKDMPLFRRNKKMKRIIFTKLKNIRDERVREIEREYQEKMKNSTPEELKLNATNFAYQRKLAIEEAVQEVINTKKTLTWLENKDVYEIYKALNNDEIYTIDDLAPLLYLKLKLEGITSKKEIKHVVIDEAQDYSLLQFIVIKAITKCYSMTIVGDTNQRILPTKEEIAVTILDKELQGLDCENYSLEKSYRSTQEIMEYANTYLKEDKIVPLVRHGEEVITYEAFDNEDLVTAVEDALEVFEEKEYDSIAVVVRDLQEIDRVKGIIQGIKGIKVYDREDMIYKGGTILIPSYLAKGLEFDGVVIINKENSTDSFENKLNYVMATRALHGLTIIKDRR